MTSTVTFGTVRDPTRLCGEWVRGEMVGASRIGVKRTPNLRRPPVERDSTRICELLVGKAMLTFLASLMNSRLR